MTQGKRRLATGLLGILVFCTASVPSMPWAVAQERTIAQTTTCPDQPGLILSLLVRDLAYRSYDYVNAGQFDLAARTLAQAAAQAAAIADPFAKTDVVTLVAGTTGGQPSSLEQLVRYGLATQQPELPLAVLPEVAIAARTLEGPYGVVNSQRLVLLQLAQYYLELDRPAEARSQLDQARSLLDSLGGDGVGLIAAPVAEGYVALGDRQSAIAILDAALGQTEAMTIPNPNYLADIWSAIATAYAKAGAVEPALQVANRIPVPQIKAITLINLARELAATAPPAQLEHLLKQSTDLALALPAPAQDQVWPPLVLAYAQVGQWQAALAGIDRIASPEAKIQTLIALAALGGERPDLVPPLLDALVDTAQGLQPFTNADDALRRAGAQYLTQHQYELAWQLSERLDPLLQEQLRLQLVEAASAAGEFVIAQQALAGLDPGWENQTRSLALRSLVQGYLNAGQVEPALRLLPQIQNTPYYPSQVSAWVAIAQFYSQTHQSAIALEQLNQALTDLSALEDSSAKLDLLGQSVLLLDRLGRAEQAQAVQTQALEMAKTSPALFGVEPLVRQFLGASNYPLALALAKSIASPQERDRMLYLVVLQQLEMGDGASAAQTAADIDDPQQQVALGVKIADYYRAWGQPQTAAAHLAQAFAIAAALPGPDEVSYADAAQMDPSIPSRDPLDRGTLLESIALRYAEMGQLDAAQQVAQALRSAADQQALQQRLTCY